MPIPCLLSKWSGCGVGIVLPRLSAKCPLQNSLCEIGQCELLLLRNACYRIKVADFLSLPDETSNLRICRIVLVLTYTCTADQVSGRISCPSLLTS